MNLDNLKLKKSRRIQSLGEARKGFSLQAVCDLCIPAASAIDDWKGHIARHQGVVDAYALLRKADKAEQAMGRT